MEVSGSSNFRKQLGKRLRAVRKVLGESQPQMAERFGVTKLSILKYEAGIFCPTVEQIHELEPIGIDVSHVAFGTPSLANPFTRRQFASVFAMVFAESRTLAPEAINEDLIEVAWTVFSKEDAEDADVLAENVRIALRKLAP